MPKKIDRINSKAAAANPMICLNCATPYSIVAMVVFYAPLLSFPMHSELCTFAVLDLYYTIHGLLVVGNLRLPSLWIEPKHIDGSIVCSCLITSCFKQMAVEELSLGNKPNCGWHARDSISVYVYIITNHYTKSSRTLSEYSALGKTLSILQTDNVTIDSRWFS